MDDHEFAHATSSSSIVASLSSSSSSASASASAAGEDSRKPGRKTMTPRKTRNMPTDDHFVNLRGIAKKVPISELLEDEKKILREAGLWPAAKLSEKYFHEFSQEQLDAMRVVRTSIWKRRVDVEFAELNSAETAKEQQRGEEKQDEPVEANQLHPNHLVLTPHAGQQEQQQQEQEVQNFQSYFQDPSIQSGLHYHQQQQQQQQQEVEINEEDARALAALRYPLF